jgi:hypothetical protein
VEKQNGGRVIHSYDPAQRQVLCGIAEQTNSTKHGGDVTCPTCRELLDRARNRAVAGRQAEAPGTPGE